MKITVIGAGRWGSFIAWYLNDLGHTVTLYGPADTPDMIRFAETRTNGIVTMPDSLTLSNDLSASLDADAVVISIGSQGLRSLLGEILACNKAKLPPFILCMKGIEISTGKRLSEVVKDCIPDATCAVWIGPGHPQEFVRGVPNCMIIDSANEEFKHYIVTQFKGPRIRFYYGSDLIGNEIGAAAKNVIGIAAGMLDGLGIPSLKGALMSRGTREVARLIKVLGGNELSAYGLAHLGDYEATVFSKFSHNRQFGESYIKGEEYTALAEGYYTTAALKNLCEKYGIEMPISEALYSILYDGADPKETLNSLFERSLKQEFE